MKTSSPRIVALGFMLLLASACTSDQLESDSRQATATVGEDPGTANPTTTTIPEFQRPTLVWVAVENIDAGTVLGDAVASGAIEAKETFVEFAPLDSDIESLQQQLDAQFEFGAPKDQVITERMLKN